jgi:hypothetical protein
VAANGSPISEGFQVVTILPGELKEPVGIEVLGFLAKEGFKAPLDVRAFPRLQAVTAGSKPIELNEMPHEKL